MSCGEYYLDYSGQFEAQQQATYRLWIGTVEYRRRLPADGKHLARSVLHSVIVNVACLARLRVLIVNRPEA